MQGGFIYVVHFGSGDAYKIGTSRNPKSRYKAIKTNTKAGDNFSPVLLAWTNKDPYYLEKYMHNIYQHKNLNGEWYHLSKEDLLDIKHILQEEADSVILEYGWYKLVMNLSVYESKLLQIAEKYNLAINDAENVLGMSYGTK